MLNCFTVYIITYSSVLLSKICIMNYDLQCFPAAACGASRISSRKFVLAPWWNWLCKVTRYLKIDAGVRWDRMRASNPFLHVWMRFSFNGSSWYAEKKASTRLAHESSRNGFRRSGCCSSCSGCTAQHSPRTDSTIPLAFTDFT